MSEKASEGEKAGGKVEKVKKGIVKVCRGVEKYWSVCLLPSSSVCELVGVDISLYDL